MINKLFYVFFFSATLSYSILEGIREMREPTCDMQNVAENTYYPLQYYQNGNYDGLSTDVQENLIKIFLFLKEGYKNKDEVLLYSKFKE